MAKLFGGGKKNKAPTPQEGIQRLREVEEMLMKKSDFLEKKIETELATAKKYGTKNKRGKCTFVPCNILNNRPPYCVCVGLHYVNVTTTPPAAPVLVPWVDEPTELAGHPPSGAKHGEIGRAMESEKQPVHTGIISGKLQPLSDR